MQHTFLFITRNYPPKVGGLEAYSYHLIKEFESNNQTFKIVLTKSNLHLFWFLPFCIIKALYICWKYNIEYVHLCDALLAPVGILLKMMTGTNISASVVGLDITYNNFFYQLLIPWCVRQLDRVICISRATRDECTSRRIPHGQCTVIPIGIHPDEVYMPQSREHLRRTLEEKTGVSLQNRRVLVTVGRLVRRKGAAWFVRNVMPNLDSRFSYLIVGDGPDRERIQELVKTHGLQNRVLLLGRLSDESRNLIFNAADIFIMPNITVPGDVEGFGIVAIEAGSCGLPVIASNIQGIRDAVIDGKTGILVEEQNVNDFLHAIENTRLERDKIRATVISTFDWSQIYKQFCTILIQSETNTSSLHRFDEKR
jgi:glycosyltransferase involved in cell wall biosynthesis